MLKPSIVTAVILAGSLIGCAKPEPPRADARPVRTITVDRHAPGEMVSLTGQVRAKDQANLAFRLDGRMIQRLVNVGDVVTAGQVIARLDPQNQENALHAAQATLLSIEARMTQARLALSRQQELLKNGWTPRAKFDDAQQTFLNVQAEADAARAQVRIAQDQLGYDTLTADGAGAVTAVGAEPGEVIRAGQMVVQLARQGGRDAVFDVPEQLVRSGPRDPRVEIVLTDAPRVRADGRVREVGPQADSATRTFQVKVAISDPPDAMRLGSTVTGRIMLSAPAGVVVPASALTETDGRPAVWIVDPKSLTVSLRSVAIVRHDATSVVISSGLETGDLVVTAGVQTLHPGQSVRLMGAVS